MLLQYASEEVKIRHHDGYRHRRKIPKRTPMIERNGGESGMVRASIIVRNKAVPCRVGEGEGGATFGPQTKSRPPMK